MRQLRVGLLGLGNMGRHHARVLRQLDGVDLVGAADPAGDVHQAAPGVDVVNDIEALLRHGIDYAVVAANTTSHAPLAQHLAANGIPALIEKPLAANLDDAIAVARAYDAAGLPCAVGHVERYNPALIALRERLARGELGTVYQVATRRLGPFPPQVSDVGATIDLATHDIDVVTWVMGRPVASIAARTGSRSGCIHEDLVAAVGELTDGTVLSHLVNWLSPKKERVTEVTGEGGCLIANTLHGDLTYHANGSARTRWDAAEIFRGVTEGDVTQFAIAKKEPLVTQHEAFRDHLNGAGAQVATPWEGARTLAVAEALLRSAATGATMTPSWPGIGPTAVGQGRLWPAVGEQTAIQAAV